MAAYLLFLPIYVNYTYWPRFGLNILFYFAHGNKVREAYTPYSKIAANKLFFCLHVY